MTPEQKIEAMLERIGQALSAGEAEPMAGFWEVPALVLSNEGALAIDRPEAITEFFRQSIQWYREQGAAGTRPEIERIDPLTMRLFEVSVRWPSLDSQGNESGAEHSRYVIRFDESDEPRIRVAITVG